jgi:serine/threonine protein kinase/WD40 repeat protein
MTDDSIFSAALAIGSPAERAAFLDRVCVNPALRKEIDELLAAHAASNLQDRPPVDLARTGAFESEDGPSAAVGDRVGPYKLLERIGEGGMGEVWVADQLEPIKRRVALKLIKPGMDSRAVLARFEAERQALAVMDHPNIAKVLDAGTTPDGRPYFVMELVKGTPITEFCDARRLSSRERLELFIPVCQAIQHAHMKGIIHRDIKPSNVLVALHDETPVPKVIDFGVAKAIGQQLTEKTIYTGFGALIGTPAYMAPEQATFNQLDVDTRADVYALGVLLYELLTGSPPVEPERLKKAALDEVLRIVRDEEPPRPSQRLSTSQAKATIAAVRQSDPAKLSNLLRGEVDWIVMKALEKDRTRRYDTATALAKDVQRYLTGEMVEARPPTLGYRMRKFANKKSTIIGTIFIVSMLPSLGWAVFGMIRAQDAEKAAEEQRESAVEERNNAEDARKEMAVKRDEAVRLTEQLRRSSYHTSIALAAASLESGQIGLTREMLERTRPKPGDKDDLRGWEWHYLRRAIHGERETIKGPAVPVDALAFSRDGRYLAVAHGGLLGNAISGSLRVIDLHKQLPDRSLAVSHGKASGLIFSPDGTRLAADVKLEIVPGSLSKIEAELRVWDVAKGTLQTVRPFTLEEGLLSTPAFSPDGNRVAVFHRGDNASGVVVTDAATGKAVANRKLTDAFGDGDVAYTADGRLLVAFTGGTKDPRVRLLDAGSENETARVVFDPGPDGSQVWTINLENGGTRLVVACRDRQVRGWDLTAAEPKLTFTFRAESMQTLVEGFRMTPDNRLCAMCPGFYGPVAPVWDVQTGRQVFAARGHTAGVRGLAISPDGRTLATGSEDKTVKLWTLPAVRTGPELTANLSTGGIAAHIDGGFRVLTLQPTGDDSYGTVAVRELPGDAEQLFVGARRLGNNRPRQFVLAPDGNRVATVNWEAKDRVNVWDVATGRKAPEFPADGIAGNSARFVTADRILIRKPDGSRQLFEIPSGRVAVVAGRWQTESEWLRAFHPRWTRVRRIRG